MVTPGFEGDLELAPLWTGQSVELVCDVQAALYSVTTNSNAAQQSNAKSRS